MGNCIAYNLITIDQGRAFLQKAPYCAPLMTLILVPFIGAKNVAFLKVGLPRKSAKMLPTLFTKMFASVQFLLNVLLVFGICFDSSDGGSFICCWIRLFYDF